MSRRSVSFLLNPSISPGPHPLWMCSCLHIFGGKSRPFPPRVNERWGGGRKLVQIIRGQQTGWGLGPPIRRLDSHAVCRLTTTPAIHWLVPSVSTGGAPHLPLQRNMGKLQGNRRTHNPSWSQSAPESSLMFSATMCEAMLSRSLISVQLTGSRPVQAGGLAATHSLLNGWSSKRPLP